MTLQEVAPPLIGVQLDKMWDAMTGSGAGKMRASLFNLIFFTENNQRAAYFRNIAQKVIEKFPSRVIFITDDPTSSKDFLKTSISAMFSSGEGIGETACDQIVIDVSGCSREKIPSIVLPHILPDLPVFLIWAGDPCREHQLSTKLEPLASRMIFDSESSEHLLCTAEKILSKKTILEVADLNWARTENWRSLFSTMFHSNKRLQELKDASNIQIVYSCKQTSFISKTEIPSLYLQMWLAVQLGWTLTQAETTKEGSCFRYQKQEGSVQIRLISDHSGSFFSSEILSVTISTSKGSEFIFSRSKETPQQVKVQICSTEACDLPFAYLLSRGESGQSLVREICHKGTSTHFLRTLQALVQMKTILTSYGNDAL